VVLNILRSDVSHIAMLSLFPIRSNSEELAMLKLYDIGSVVSILSEKKNIYIYIYIYTIATICVTDHEIIFGD